VPLHPIKIGIIVSIFFNETIIPQKYQRLPLEPFINQLDHVELTNGYFQQNLATTHTTRTIKHYSEELFSNRLISVALWPSQSPDLTPLDLFCSPIGKTQWFESRLTICKNYNEQLKI
jgi:myosin-crossreactive antigen